MNNIKSNQLKNILRMVAKSDDSDFYKNIFSKAGFSVEKFNTQDDMKNIPIISSDHLLSAKLSERLYKKGSAFGKLAKIAKNSEFPFLVQRNLDDIKEENYGLPCDRPQILLSNSHEALEKSMWFYVNNIAPLIGEPRNLRATVFGAIKFSVDLLVTEEKTLWEYWPILTANYDTSNLKIIVLGSSFDLARTSGLLGGKIIDAKFILDLPETGALAESCPFALAKGTLFFHSDKNSIVEANENLIVSKVIILPTPIIRYQTNIRGRVFPNDCNCKRESGFAIGY